MLCVKQHERKVGPERCEGSTCGPRVCAGHGPRVGCLANVGLVVSSCALSIQAGSVRAGRSLCLLSVPPLSQSTASERFSLSPDGLSSSKTTRIPTLSNIHCHARFPHSFKYTFRMRSYTAALAASPLFFLAVSAAGIVDNMAHFDTISVRVLVFRSGLFLALGKAHRLSERDRVSPSGSRETITSRTS